jgi:hypothetical protein
MVYSYISDGCDTCETVSSTSPFTNVTIPQQAQQQVYQQVQQQVPQQVQQQVPQQVQQQVPQQVPQQVQQQADNVILSGIDTIMSPLVQQQQQQQQQQKTNKTKGLLFKTDNVMIVLALVTISALSVNTTIKHYIEKAIKFNDGSSRYFIIYTVVACIITIIVYNMLEMNK